MSETNSSTATVRDYETADELDGVASEELVRESAAAGDSGAVPAYRDEAGVWQYVAPSEEEFMERHRGVEVRTVYIEADN